MIMLDNVQENAVRDNLKKRYAKDEIYTYIGDVLISVNPFKNISNMYSDVSGILFPKLFVIHTFTS